MAVIAANLHAQAAVEGGVPVSIAYDMSGIFTRKIEVCKTVDDIIQLMMNIAKEFTLKVKEYKENRNDSSYIERSKNYVIQKINQPISLESIAAYVQLNKCYLSKMFYEKEGMHLQEFIHRERVKAAANMLKYSDVSLSNIASYFCFVSQSHFGVIFKKYQGMTPKQYRDKNQISEFISKKEKRIETSK